MEIKSLENNLKKVDEYINLIETEFKYQKPFSYKIDFAPLFSSRNLSNCFYLEENNKIVATAACILKDMTFKNATLKICMIGAIATKNEYQGRGLFKRLFNHILEKNINQVGLFILWSDQHSLYEKYEFYPAGKTVELGNSDFKKPEQYEGINFNQLSNDEKIEIKNLYKENIEEKFFSIKRNENWDEIYKISSANLYIRRNSQNIITSYFFCNKGFDLTNIIHEIGSKQLEDELKLLKNLKVWLPENYKNYNSHVGLNITALIKIGNIKIIEQFINTYSLKNIQLYNVNKMIHLKYKDIESNFSYENFLINWLELTNDINFQDIQISPYISGIDSI